MATPLQNVDELIMYLVGMGFEVEDCQQAIQAGKITIQDAVEWLLQGKPSPDVTTGSGGSGHLNLSHRQTVGSSLDAFVAPAPISMETETPTLSAKQDSTESSKDVESRIHLSEEQSKIKDQFDIHQREEARKKAKQEKLLQKKAKADALKQIAEDRERRKQTKRQTAPPVVSSLSGSNLTTKTDSIQEVSSLLQIRLPDGQVLKHKFLATDTLEAVRQFVEPYLAPGDAMCFIQPFPRKEFSQSDMACTLADLALTPSGSLVVKKAAPPAGEYAEDNVSSPNVAVTVPVSGGQGHQEGHVAATVPVSGGQGHQEGHLDFDGQGQEFDDEMEGHEWGQGHFLANPDEGEGHVGDEEMEAEIDQGDNNLPGQDMPGMGHRLDERYLSGEGQGQENNPTYPAAQLAARAAQQREADYPGADNKMGSPAKKHRHQPILSLLDLSISLICNRLCSPQLTHQSLGALPSNLATKLLAHLRQEKLLNVKTLKPFVMCKLRKVVLDCYPLVTNELLLNLRYHTYIQYLSLSSCSLFNDKGLLPLKSLHNLKTLNLSCCRQLTDKVFAVISEFQSLVSLSLEDTSTTDVGVIEFCDHGPPDLHLLNLNKTAVTQNILPHLPELKKLKNLSLEYTKVKSLSGIQAIVGLESLNVCGTDIVAESLLLLQGLSHLVALNIGQTENMNGDQALQYISELRLKMLELPSRHTTSDKGLSFISDMKLSSLNLTNYIHITDSGLQHVGNIKSLRKLLLSNTKITDEGMFYLEGLSKLEVLYIDRTLVSDAGVVVLKSLKSLTELSLSETLITDTCLKDGYINGCGLMTKLNMSKTSLTNQGVGHLSLPYLSLLNLDYTYCTLDLMSGELMVSCPAIVKMTMTNCRPPSLLNQ